MNFTKKIVIWMFLVGFLVNDSQQRPPINSDFVNGPWARIGKRAGTSVCNYLNRVDLSESIKGVLLVKCIAEWKAKQLGNLTDDEND